MKTDKEKHSLRGPVRSVDVKTAQFKEEGGELVEQLWFAHTIVFNPYGQIVEQVNRNPDGIEWRTINDYSDSGKLLATRHYDPSGTMSGEVSYIYDDQGRLVAEQSVNQDGKASMPVTYAWDNEGRKMKIEELDFPGDANVLIGIEGTNSSIEVGGATRIETSYDETQEAVEVKVFNSDGVLTTRTEITRNEQGNPLEEIQYVGDALPFGPCSTEACPTEAAVELTAEQKVELEAEMSRMFSTGTVMSKHTHTYDDAGRLIESRLTMMDMEVGRQTFAYNEFGDKSEEVSYDEEGTFSSKAIFTRKYEEQGNWIEEIVSTASSWDADFRLSTPVHITRRVITYY